MDSAKSGIRITRDENSCGTNPEYPLVLSVQIHTDSFTFRFTYMLRIDEASKTASGVIRGGGGLSEIVLDDMLWDDYAKVAERESVSAVRDYLNEMFPHSFISGKLRSEFESAYHKPHDYSI